MKKFHQNAIDKLHESLATGKALAQAAQEGAEIHLRSQAAVVVPATEETNVGTTETNAT